MGLAANKYIYRAERFAAHSRQRLRNREPNEEDREDIYKGEDIDKLIARYRDKPEHDHR